MLAGWLVGWWFVGGCVGLCCVCAVFCAVFCAFCVCLASLEQPKESLDADVPPGNVKGVVCTLVALRGEAQYWWFVLTTTGWGQLCLFEVSCSKM